MEAQATMGGWRIWRPGPYRDALAVPPFRRLYVGEALSGLGDGCSVVAVAWLALQIAAPTERPYAVGFALAAYGLPGAVVGLAVASRLGRLDARRLLLADALLRMLLLGCIPLLYRARLALAARL